MTKLEKAFSDNKELSLRKLAASLEVNHALLLKKAKEPVPGQVYDPNAINWTAVEEAIQASRKKANKSPIDFEKLNYDEIAGIKVVAPVKETNLEVGDEFTMTYKPYSGLIWKVMLKTATHVCIMAADSTEPKVMAFGTLYACGAKKLAKSPQESRDGLEA
jgi:hypothetical protein